MYMVSPRAIIKTIAQKHKKIIKRKYYTKSIYLLQKKTVKEEERKKIKDIYENKNLNR